MNKPVKVLILRFSSIGDIVLTTPVIRCLKQQINAEIHYFTKSKFQFLLADNPYVDKIWLLDKDINPVLTQLKAEHFDYIIDLHANIRTLRIKVALGVKAFSFDKLNALKWLLTTFKVDYLPNIHIVDRYMETLHVFQVTSDGQGLDYFIPYKDNVETSWLPPTHRQAFVAYAIGGQHNTKKLPVPRMIELCRKINFPIVLLGGKEDFDAGEAIRTAIGDDLILNTCGKYNFNQSASLVQKSLIVFSHDTGLMHVASAFKKKVYSIWGNTIPGFGMYPYKTAFEVLENNNLKCRPCSKIGYKACPQKHFKCMNELSFDFPIKELPEDK
ncbi:glycosyltransferase family 9 protein [Dyadobacter fanqingshengii]|uniref:Glycosyltransferase family 9 protein n=1 Tax=Dyadobacter fanqingshengii TaxID=2906443 RepID=A0A9X1PF77_9BACT|nr:glycosyltransferase family 9 protein [Dyadobacter fanqingshengii]MCF0042778.1 glycosyltransferase family 9 protein [Dyadobacter fanqingshengii]MCF2504451.1 glycosyltransferase family 9 protein [Dyadobacter fanqingshengii]USJ36001.1 glycosyltransferase family 9 protein [Dyadobacter fanqingshengii]